MAGLARLIEGYQPGRRLDCGVEVAALHLAVCQAVQGGHGQRAQPVALDGQPLLEGRLPEPQPLQQVAPIEEGGPLQGLRVGLGREPFEIDDIHGDSGGIHGHGLAGRPEHVLRQASAQGEQGLPNAMARLIGPDIGPQQGGKTVAGVSLARADRENGEQGLDLLAQDEGSGPGGRPHFKAPQQR